MIPTTEAEEENIIEQSTENRLELDEEKQIVHDLREMLGQVTSDPESSNLSTPSEPVEFPPSKDFDLNSLFGDTEQQTQHHQVIEKKRKLEDGSSYPMQLHVPKTDKMDVIRQIKREMVDRHQLLTTYSALKTSFVHITNTLKTTKEKLKEAENWWSLLSTENTNLKNENHRIRSEYETEVNRLKRKCGELE
ncbi:hypothetical protein TRICI_000818 [Trichomonascus ciferrii]|uniref:Uncharacterized protein n=1 Tax=Trichomonascus ciferrii TaxID=44093 RepID=A0A642VA75_9ASCO|nr:hypothetical protein TRICI_000818 [Trichomonascus ciferrii]